MNLSNVELLPQKVKAWLDKLLRENRQTQIEILAILNAELEKRRANVRISRSGLSRYKQKFEKIGARLRETEAIAQLFVSEFGVKPAGDVGRLLIELVRTLVYDLSRKLTEGDEPASAAVLEKLARAIHHLESANKVSADREIAIRKEVAKQAADRAVKAAGDAAIKAGHKLSPAALKTIREQVYGIVD